MSANQLLDEVPPGLGHNMPPLGEYLADILAPLRQRQAQLIRVAETARIIDQLSAEKVVDLDRLLKCARDEIERLREETKRPYLEACRTIDATFGAASQPLDVARQGADGRGGLRAVIAAWQRQQEERARAERERLEAEQRLAQTEAEASRRAAEKARENGRINIGDELAVMQAEEAARRLGERAAAAVPPPLRSHLGAAGIRREIVFDITNARLLLGWLLKQQGLAGQVEHATRTIIGKYLRSLGVVAVEKGIAIPGLEAWIEHQTTVRS